MAGTPGYREPTINIGGGWRTQGKGPHDDSEVRAAYSLRHAEKLTFFLTGMELAQFRVTRRKQDYLVMLKGKRGGKRYVAFLNASTFEDALVLAATSLDCGALAWKEERPWAPK